MAGPSDSNSDDGLDDRRHGDRVPINQEFSGDGTWVSDLSHGGVFVHGAELLPVGSIIDLHFTVLLDDPIPIAAVAKVVRHSRNPPGIGVQFTDLAPEMRARIDAVLERQRPLDSGAPLRLPEPRPDTRPNIGPGARPAPSHRDQSADEAPRWARPAPVGGLSMVPSAVDADDDVTRSFERPKLDDDEPTSFFRPPPLPGKR